MDCVVGTPFKESQQIRNSHYRCTEASTAGKRISHLMLSITRPPTAEAPAPRSPESHRGQVLSIFGHISDPEDTLGVEGLRKR